MCLPKNETLNHKGDHIGSPLHEILFSNRVSWGLIVSFGADDSKSMRGAHAGDAGFKITLGFFGGVHPAGDFDFDLIADSFFDKADVVQISAAGAHTGAGFEEIGLSFNHQFGHFFDFGGFKVTAFGDKFDGYGRIN